MLKGITINFTCASQQKPCTNSLCQTQHIQSSHDICLVQSVKKSKFEIKETQNIYMDTEWTQAAKVGDNLPLISVHITEVIY
jgi:hypothetical protein